MAKHADLVHTLPPYPRVPFPALRRLHSRQGSGLKASPPSTSTLRRTDDPESGNVDGTQACLSRPVLRQQVFDDFPAISEIRLFQPLDGLPQIDQLLLGGQIEDAESAGDLDPVPDGGGITPALVDENEVGLERDREEIAARSPGSRLESAESSWPAAACSLNQAGGDLIQVWTAGGAEGSPSSRATSVGIVTAAKSW